MVTLSVMKMSKVWDKEWLKEKYHNEKLSACEIAELTDVTHTTVLKWVDKHGLERVERHERREFETKQIYETKRWKNVAKSVRERDDFRCQSCGVRQSEQHRKLDVHHIRPAKSLIKDDKVDDKAVFDEQNLVTLCPSCHLSKWEGIPLRPKLIEG
jgi:hypothetical protein